MQDEPNPASEQKVLIEDYRGPIKLATSNITNMPASVTSSEIIVKSYETTTPPANTSDIALWFAAAVLLIAIGGVIIFFIPGVSAGFIPFIMVLIGAIAGPITVGTYHESRHPKLVVAFGILSMLPFVGLFCWFVWAANAFISNLHPTNGMW